jgi:hypothetical protein
VVNTLAVRRGKWGVMRKAIGWLTGAALLVTLCTGIGSGAGAVGNSSTQGVAQTTIRVGIPYVDLAPLKALGTNLNQGSYPDAYNALIKSMNAHGGINGRRIVPYLIAVNPAGTAAAATACTQMTEDDRVFVAIAPLEPDCYLQHNTPTIQGLGTFQTVFGSVPNFTLTPPAAAYDPLQLSVFAKQGVFKGKKVGLYAGSTTDEDELKVVQSSLKKLRVNVVQSAVNSAPETDQTAGFQQIAIVAQRFKSAGVNEVVAVGAGSAGWPEGLEANQSAYHPPWVATSDATLAAYLLGSKPSSAYLNVIASSPVPSVYQAWQDPAVQKCASIVRKAYPNDQITPPKNPVTGSDQSFAAVEFACQDLALFTAITKPAGKNLTISSFTRSGYALRSITLPGSGGPVSFGPGQPYAIGPVFLATYNPRTGALQQSTKSATS